MASFLVAVVGVSIILCVEVVENVEWLTGRRVAWFVCSRRSISARSQRWQVASTIKVSLLAELFVSRTLTVTVILFLSCNYLFSGHYTRSIHPFVAHNSFIISYPFLGTNPGELSHVRNWWWSCFEKRQFHFQSGKQQEQPEDLFINIHWKKTEIRLAEWIVSIEWMLGTMIGWEGTKWSIHFAIVWGKWTATIFANGIDGWHWWWVHSMDSLAVIALLDRLCNDCLGEVWWWWPIKWVGVRRAISHVYFGTITEMAASS